MKREKLTLKQTKFVRETARTLNPTEGAMRAYDVVKRSTASEIAKENLDKPYVKKALEELLEEKMTKEEVLGVLSRNIEQDKNISASNQAIDIRFKLSGDYAPVKSMSINKNISSEERSKRIDELIAQLAELRAPSPALNTAPMAEAEEPTSDALEENISEDGGEHPR